MYVYEFIMFVNLKWKWAYTCSKLSSGKSIRASSSVQVSALLGLVKSHKSKTALRMDTD